MGRFVDLRWRLSALRGVIHGEGMGLIQCLPPANAVGPNKKSRSKLRHLVLVIS
jgi:hypothetical protein